MKSVTDMVKPLRQFGRRLLHPFPDLGEVGILPSHLLSPLDLIAEKIGVSCTEKFFANSTSAQAITRAFCRFMADPEAERALKKEFHVFYEASLRRVALHYDPAERHGFDPLRTVGARQVN